MFRWGCARTNKCTPADTLHTFGGKITDLHLSSHHRQPPGHPRMTLRSGWGHEETTAQTPHLR
eukprot:1161347-Pelagomonas_calceolata.AAC.11